MTKLLQHFVSSLTSVENVKSPYQQHNPALKSMAVTMEMCHTQVGWRCVCRGNVLQVT